MDINKIRVGDRIKVRIATRSGWIRGWRVVNRVDKHIAIRAHGWQHFVVRPEEISDVKEA